MEAFIRSTCAVSPQTTWYNSGFLNAPRRFFSNRITAEEPDYKEFIPPIQIRRMSRFLKMGLTASHICLKESNTEHPDAIIVGTAMGNAEYLEKFLASMTVQQETNLSPTPFIQSTHNAIASQIAMLQQNHNYNMTYSHRALSFEWALLDALLLIREKEAANVLIGGIDLATDILFTNYGYLGYWKKETADNFAMLHAKTDGTILGEGAAFFVLSDEAGDNDYAVFRDVYTFLKPESNTTIHEEIAAFMARNGLSSDTTGMVLFGINGDQKYDRIYYDLQNTLFDKTKTHFCYYKSLCGEYFTSTSFACWMAAGVLKRKTIPDIIRISSAIHKFPENILIYNHFRNEEHSLILLSAVD
ncbi:MAG: beta-ketoacyl synthase chain length factor [Bacteroidetes bacterium]|nr:beta-ketoacyl synthase chain length factor [Bacteroidota bacterium]